MESIPSKRPLYDLIVARAEDHMRAGRWEEAELDLSDVCSSADLFLRMAQLQERKSCAEYLDEAGEDDIPYSQIHATLFSRWDKYTAEWALTEYKSRRI